MRFAVLSREALSHLMMFLIGALCTFVVFAFSSTVAGHALAAISSIGWADNDLGKRLLALAMYAALLISAIVVAFIALDRWRAYRAASLVRGETGSRKTPGEMLESISIDDVRDVVKDQVLELMADITHFLDVNASQTASLEVAQSDLDRARTSDHVRSIIVTLVESNRKARTEAAALSEKLDAARTHAALLRQQLDVAEKVALLDPLTSLPNRRAFQRRCEEAIAKAHAELMPLTVLMVDIDHFKSINDRFGHPAGDSVLVNVGNTLSGSVRASDFVGRYGGEEFVLVFESTPMGTAFDIAERIRTNLKSVNWSRTLQSSNHERLTVSIGIAEINHDENVESLIRRADQALYLAKRKGRDRVETSMAERLQRAI